MEVEQDRDGDKRENTIWSRKYYLPALTDATKVVKVIVGKAKKSTDTTVNASKTYYKQHGTGYIVGTPTANPSTENFYEIG